MEPKDYFRSLQVVESELYTLKYKGYLLVSKNLYIYGTFPIHKRF